MEAKEAEEKMMRYFGEGPGQKQVRVRVGPWGADTKGLLLI